MENLENYFADEIKSLDELIEKNKKGAIKRSVNWVKEKYRDFIIYNGELLIAEGVASAVETTVGEVLGNHLESDFLVAAGASVTSGLSCWGTYGFMAYLERRKDYSSTEKTFAKHMGKFILLNSLSGGIKLCLMWYCKSKGFSGGEAALLAKGPSLITHFILMNTLGYKMGLVGKDKKV